MKSDASAPSDLKDVPTGMETDPNADEQVIDQTDNELTNDAPAEEDQSEAEEPKEGEETPADELTNALAYAIDGSGTGLAGAPPVAPTVGTPQKIITEGATGAGLED